MSAVKKKKPQPWKEISHGVYTDVINHCVHFSSRPVNTNARPAGVRLNDAAVPMPYLAVCTVGPNRVDVDYLRNGGSEAGPFKQIRAVLEQRLDEFDDVKVADVEHIQQVCSTSSAFEFDTHNIDPRLRQILWPTGNDEYLALTPLPSAGLSYLINSTVTALNDKTKAENDAADEKSNKGSKLNTPKKRGRYYSRSTLGIGGANTQNAGGLVYSMTRPLVFSAPQESIDVRQGFAAYYKGIRYQNSRRLLDEYGLWLYKRRGKTPSKNTVRIRAQARDLVQRIGRDILRRADDAIGRIEKVDLPGCCSPDLPDVQQGLLDPTRRNNRWCRLIATDIARAVGNHRFRVSGEKELVSVALDDTEIGVISGYIEELLR